MKPEVSAPGGLTWSAMSTANDQYTCPTTPGATLTPAQLAGLVFATQGTSMATPTTAGNAALVRQYFTDGWYPLGTLAQGKILDPIKIGAPRSDQAVNCVSIWTFSDCCCICLDIPYSLASTLFLTFVTLYPRSHTNCSTGFDDQGSLDEFRQTDER